MDRFPANLFGALLLGALVAISPGWIAETGATLYVYRLGGAEDLPEPEFPENWDVEFVSLPWTPVDEDRFGPGAPGRDHRRFHRSRKDGPRRQPHPDSARAAGRLDKVVGRVRLRGRAAARFPVRRGPGDGVRRRRQPLQGGLELLLAASPEPVRRQQKPSGEQLQGDLAQPRRRLSHPPGPHVPDPQVLRRAPGEVLPDRNERRRSAEGGHQGHELLLALRPIEFQPPPHHAGEHRSPARARHGERSRPAHLLRDHRRQVGGGGVRDLRLRFRPRGDLCLQHPRSRGTGQSRDPDLVRLAGRGSRGGAHRAQRQRHRPQRILAQYLPGGGAVALRRFGEAAYTGRLLRPGDR